MKWICPQQYLRTLLQKWTKWIFVPPNILYVRALDLVGAMSDRILVKRKLLNFFGYIKYEKVSLLCSKCWSIGHLEESCWRATRTAEQGSENQHTSSEKNGINRGGDRNVNNNQGMQRKEPSIAAKQNGKQGYQTGWRGDKGSQCAKNMDQ